MGYSYNKYGTEEVKKATDTYNNLASLTPTYKESYATKEAKTQADKYADKYKQNMNSGYSSNYQNSINQLVDKYVNNDFKWKANDSSNFQQLSDKYKREGSVTQENVTGNYSSNTGGYSNSYAQTAGQKAFNNYMDELQKQIPSFKQEAQASWSEQQENTLNQIGMLQNLDDMQYQRYRDNLQDDYDFMSYYQNKYATEKGLDMSAFQNELSKWQSQMNAAAGNLSSVRQLAQQQYEHNTLSADAHASINSSKKQTDAYYKWLNEQLK